MIKSVRLIIGDLFQSPVASMNYPAYFNYINTSGKITARALMDLSAIMLTLLEEQERINLEHDNNSKQIFEILAKLAKRENVELADIAIKAEALNNKPFVCSICKKELKTKLALAGHSRSHQVK